MVGSFAILFGTAGGKIQQREGHIATAAQHMGYKYPSDL
jgi:hypothetical protein